MKPNTSAVLVLTSAVGAVAVYVTRGSRTDLPTGVDAGRSQPKPRHAHARVREGEGEVRSVANARPHVEQPTRLKDPKSEREQNVETHYRSV